MKINASALVFPGQGSQRIGMGKALYTNFAVAKEVFDKVDNALSFKLSSLMFDGDIEELNKTSNAQPAIMTVSMAYFEVLKSLVIIDGRTFAGRIFGIVCGRCFNFRKHC